MDDGSARTGWVEGNAFPSTQWSMVARAGCGSPASVAALESLCRSYWPPIFAHLRMKGHSLHEAEDLTQEFFSRMLAGNGFAQVSPDRGRFRTFLLASLRNFSINEWKRGKAAKRGGGVVKVDLDAMDPALRDACEPRSEEDIARHFEKHWALTLLAKVKQQMRREYEAAGQADRHDALKGYLLDGEPAGSYAETAARLGISEAAVKSAIYKIRQRFGQILRAEIAKTVGDAGDVEDELRELIAALGR